MNYLYNMICYIYKLIKKDALTDDMVYIGSTIRPKHRLETHIGKHNNPNISKSYNCKLYKYIRENGGFDEWEMVILDKFEIFNDKCKKRDNYENKFIIAYDAINKLNSEKVGSNWKENWRELRKADDTWFERSFKYTKTYKDKNREKINEKKREKIPCDVCGTLICKSGMARHKKRFNCI